MAELRLELAALQNGPVADVLVASTIDDAVAKAMAIEASMSQHLSTADTHERVTILERQRKRSSIDEEMVALTELTTLIRNTAAELEASVTDRINKAQAKLQEQVH